MKRNRRQRFVILGSIGLLAPTLGALNLPFLPLKPTPLPDHSITFEFRHAIHVGGHKYPGLRVRLDLSDADRRAYDLAAADGTLLPPGPGFAPPLYDDTTDVEAYGSRHTLRSKKEKIWKPKGTWDQWQRARRKAFLTDRAARGSRNASAQLEAWDINADSHLGELDWDGAEVEVPDFRDLETLSSLAKMSSNAYSPVGDSGWYDPGGKWNVSDSFGWELDGVRGHIFATPNNETVVLAIKGTSAGSFGVGGPTGVNDKLNDNLLFSCCCARVDWTWTPVCDCYDSPYRCSSPCLEHSLITKSVYFPIATDLYNNVSSWYPNSNIWLTGHSLGSALASLLSLTFGAPMVGFEAPPELMAARRLHLPLPPGASWGEGREGSGVTHVYHTADPLAMGTCNGALSTCYIAGFAMESSCHAGRSIIYDTVSELNWSVDVRTHGIRNVIEHVLRPDWNSSKLAASPARSAPAAPSACAPNALTVGRTSGKGSPIWQWRWPWTGRRGRGDGASGDDEAPCDGSGDDSGDEDGRDPVGGPGIGGGNVPAAVPSPCEAGDCFKWEFFDDFDERMRCDSPW